METQEISTSHTQIPGPMGHITGGSRYGNVLYNIPGAPTWWVCDFEPFYAKQIWPTKLFLCDWDNEREAEGSDAEVVAQYPVGLQCGRNLADAVQNIPELNRCQN